MTMGPATKAKIKRLFFSIALPQRRFSNCPTLVDVSGLGSLNFRQALLARRVVGLTRRSLQCDQLPNAPDNGQAEEKQCLQGFVFAVIHGPSIEGLDSRSMAGDLR